MTQQYSQTVEVKVSSKTKSMQWIGIAAILFSLGFLMLTIFLAWYFLFPFVIIGSIGVVYLHFYNSSAKEFTYEFSPESLTVVKKDLLGKQRRLLTLMLEDAVEFSIMDGLKSEQDVVACSATYECGVYQLIYKDGAGTLRLLFAPDDYMVALIGEVLKDIERSKPQGGAHAE